jgi:hypothetical protein
VSGPRPADAARNIYVREDVLLVWLAKYLASDFNGYCG